MEALVSTGFSSTVSHENPRSGHPLARDFDVVGVCAYGLHRSFASELKRLGEVLGTDGIGLIQIGDGARDTQDSIVASRRECQPRERQVEHAARIGIEVRARSQLSSLQPRVEHPVA